jgi:hypothetical protein
MQYRRKPVASLPRMLWESSLQPSDAGIFSAQPAGHDEVFIASFSTKGRFPGRCRHRQDTIEAEHSVSVGREAISW